MKKFGWRQLAYSAGVYAVLAALAVGVMIAFQETPLVLVGGIGFAAAAVACAVHVIAAGVRLADEDRVLSSDDVSSRD